MIKLTNYEQTRKDILDSFAKKQTFRVAIGKSTWVEYKDFNPAYNLREVLNDEIIIEFDTDRATSLHAINATCLNLYSAGISFEIYDHQGRSPHLHIHDLPISNLTLDKRRLFKKLFIRKYVPLEYLKFVDLSLTGIHLVRLEYSPCWKSKYGVKELIYKFNPLQDKQGETA